MSSEHPGSTGPTVFLSYAVEDADPASKICEALREDGVEVWFDHSALRGGEAWDQKIRTQIGECALFIPIISEHTEARDEGHFRHEWMLGVERARKLAGDQAFLMPIVVDATATAKARMPDEFRAVHALRLPGGEGAWGLGERVQRLLGQRGTPEARLQEVVTGSRAPNPGRRDSAPAVPAPTAAAPAARIEAAVALPRPASLPASARVTIALLAGAVIAALVFWPRR